MRSLRSLPLLLALALACAAFDAALAADGDAPWRAGTARVKITPEEPIWLAGYAARTKPSDGVQQDLYAKALAIEDRDGTRLVIVTSDLIGIPRELRDALLVAVKQRYGLSAESLVLNASHTHCGPELRVVKAGLYGLPPERVAQTTAYVEGLEAMLLDVIGAALDQLQPARLRYATARAGFAMNRRLPTVTGVRNSPYPDGPVDHQVPVLSVHNASGDLTAVLFGYACHNTTLNFQKISGDYAGYAQHYLEQSHPGATALFMMGCGGDQNPYPRREPQYVEHHGRALANAVETALQVQQPREVDGPLRVAMDEVELRFEPPPTRGELESLQQSSNPNDRRRAAALLEQLDRDGAIRDTYSYPISVARLGDDLTLVALSGEVVVDYSIRLKHELAGEAAVWVAGYSHDVFGYVPSRRVRLEGGYEGGDAMRNTTLPGPFDPSVEQTIISGVKQLAAAAAAP